MPRPVAQTAFVTGEIDETMLFQGEIEPYYQGCVRARNVIGFPQGGFGTRPGTVDRGALPAPPYVFAPFRFSASQRYVIVLSDGEARIFKAGVLVATLTGAPWTAAHVPALAWDQNLDTMIVTHTAFAPTAIQRQGSDSSWAVFTWNVKNPPTFEFDPPRVRNAELRPSLVEGDLVQVTTQFRTAVSAIAAAGSAEVFLNTDQRIEADQILNIATVTGEKTVVSVAAVPAWAGSTVYALGDVRQNAGNVYRCDGAGTSAAPGPTHGAGSAADGGGVSWLYLHAASVGGYRMIVDSNCDASGSGLAVAEVSFRAADVGKRLRGNGGYAKIRSVTDHRTVLVDTIERFGDVDDVGFWSLEEEAMSAARGWPGVCLFYKERLLFGGFESLPGHLAASRVNDTRDFNMGRAEDTYGFLHEASGNSVARIVGMVAARDLQILTDAGVWYVPASADFTPEGFDVQSGPEDAMKPGVRPVRIEGQALFVEADGGRLLRLGYAGEADETWVADDVALFSGDLVRAPVALAVRPARSPKAGHLVLVVNGDGTLAVYQTLRRQRVNGMHLLEYGGKVLAAAVDDRDVYLAVERVLGGATSYRLEKWDTAAYSDDGAAASGLGAPVASVGGLSHLEGETVEVVVDGNFRGTAVVSGGAVALSPAAESAYSVGLPWPSVADEVFAARFPGFSPRWLVRTVPLEGKALGRMQAGRRAQVTRATVRCVAAGGFQVDGFRIATRRAALVVYDGPPLTLSEEVTLNGLPGWRAHVDLDLWSTTPQPVTVIGLALEFAA